MLKVKQVFCVTLKLYDLCLSKNLFKVHTLKIHLKKVHELISDLFTVACLWQLYLVRVQLFTGNISLGTFLPVLYCCQSVNDSSSLVIILHRLSNTAGNNSIYCIFISGSPVSVFHRKAEFLLICCACRTSALPFIYLI